MLTLGLYYILRCCMRCSLVLPHTSWSSFPDLMTFFLLLQNSIFPFKFFLVFFFFLVYSKSLPHISYSSTSSLPPPSPSAPPCSFLFIKLLLVALVSRSNFSKSALKWLVVCYSTIYNHRNPFCSFYTRFHSSASK